MPLRTLFSYASLPPGIRRMGEGNVFSLFTSGGGGSGQSADGGGVRSASGGGGGQVSQLTGEGQVQPAGGGSGQSANGGGGSGPASGGGVRSSRGGQVSQLTGGGQVQPGGVSQRGGSASCALLRAVCLLRSRRRTFLFVIDFTGRMKAR